MFVYLSHGLDIPLVVPRTDCRLRSGDAQMLINLKAGLCCCQGGNHFLPELDRSPSAPSAHLQCLSSLPASPV